MKALQLLPSSSTGPLSLGSDDAMDRWGIVLVPGYLDNKESGFFLGCLILDFSFNQCWNLVLDRRVGGKEIGKRIYGMGLMHQTQNTCEKSQMMFSRIKKSFQ